MKYLSIIILFFCILGCKKSLITDPKAQYDQMVLIYISANNDLKYDANKTINKIQQGFKVNPRTKLLMYVTTDSERSYLIDIKGNSKTNKNDTVHFTLPLTVVQFAL